MKRIITTILLLLCGLAIVAFAIYLLVQSRQWAVIVFAGSSFLFGILFAISAYEVFHGASIKEVLHDILETIFHI